MVVRDLTMINMDELVRLHICERGVQADPAPAKEALMPQAAALATRTMPQRMLGLEEEIHGLRESLGE
ncbi:hypothetical protein Tco_1138778 [Tanacetum coccineum]